jgi:hypothetical protein
VLITSGLLKSYCQWPSSTDDPSVQLPSGCGRSVSGTRTSVCSVAFLGARVAPDLFRVGVPARCYTRPWASIRRRTTASSERGSSTAREWSRRFVSRTSAGVSVVVTAITSMPAARGPVAPVQPIARSGSPTRLTTPATAPSRQSPRTSQREHHPFTARPLRQNTCNRTLVTHTVQEPLRRSGVPGSAFAAIAYLASCWAIRNTSLPRTWPASTSSWARATSSIGRTSWM